MFLQFFPERNIAQTNKNAKSLTQCIDVQCVKYEQHELDWKPWGDRQQEGNPEAGGRVLGDSTNWRMVPCFRDTVLVNSFPSAHLLVLADTEICGGLTQCEYPK